MIFHHYKRHFNHASSYLIYGLLIVYFAVSGMQLSTLGLADLSVNIGVVDNAKSAMSEQYFNDLSRQAILTLRKTDYSEGIALLEREILDLLIVIPPNYSPDNTGQKIDYIHLKTNVIAPTALDLVAIDLMPHVIQKRLVMASKMYHVGNEGDALDGYSSYINQLSENLNVEVLTVDHASQIREEQAIITLNSAKNNLLFSLFIIVLVAVLPLSLRLKTDLETRRRLSISKRGIVGYYLNEHLTSFLYLIVLWLVAVIAVASSIQLNRALTLFIIISGSSIIIVYYEVFRLLLNSSKQGYISSLIALLTIILPAILGGVFFDSNLLPAKLFKLVSVLPFSAIERAFYNGLSLYGLKLADITILLGYGVGAVLLLLLNLNTAKKIA